MGTRSFIAMELENGQGYRTVYCHWDGYPSHNGRILHTHYSDPAKLTALLDLGSISSLGTDLGQKHDFNNRGDNPAQTTFYGRDRGENGTEAVVYPGLNALIDMVGDSWADYLYVYSNGVWAFARVGIGGVNTPLAPLAAELERIGENEHVS
jgi:hypothetical protein